MISEEKKIVPVALEIDLSGTVYTHSINCKDLVGKVCFVFALNSLAGASSTFTVTSATADNTYTNAIRFNYAFGGAAIGTATAGSATSADVLTDYTSASTLTLTYGTYADFMLIVEVDLADMVSSSDDDWLACVFTTTSSVTGTVTGFAICEPRYPGSNSATVLA